MSYYLLFFGILIFFFILISIFFYIFFVIEDLNYEEIDIYIEAIEKTWNNYPILDISLTRKYGFKEIILMDMKDINIICDCSHIEEFKLQYKGYCSDYKLEVGCNEYNPINKASKIYGTKLYVSYYEADYLTLFKRLRNDKGELNSKLCKDGYKRCGYLDLLKNTLCVKEEEICPINNIKFNLFENGTIKEIITDNTQKDSYIINQLIASEMEYPTIFDINKFSPLYSDEYVYGRGYYSLSNIAIPKVIKKSDFFEENELMKGKTPYYFENESIYLFHLYYPGMNVTYPIKFISLIKQPFRSIIKIIHLFFEIGIIILIFTIKKKRNKLVIIINIIIIIIFLAFILLNIFRFIAKYYLLENLINMNYWHIYGSPTEYILRLIFLIIIPDFILIISNSILIYKKKDDNNAEEPLLVN
jgi:hypothetical protein